MSGTRADRPGLVKTLEMLREGDTLVVCKLDRLGRSVKQLVDLVGELHKELHTAFGKEMVREAGMPLGPSLEIQHYA